MNKFFKITVVAAVTFTAAGVFAAPPHRKHCEENKGIRLATDIVNLVGSSIRLLTGTPDTVIVNQPAVVTTPVVTTPVVTTPVVTTPVVTAPVVVTPPRRPIIIHNPPPRRVHHVHHYRGKPNNRPNRPHRR